MISTAWPNIALIGRDVFVGHRRRRIVGVYFDIDGGIILDRAVHGFRSWNLDDSLVRVCQERVDRDDQQGRDE